MSHRHDHAFTSLNPLTPEGLTLSTRRNFLKAGLAGMAGLTLPGLLRHRADAARAGLPSRSGKSVLLLWMAGGPSHIDTWDPKPNRPPENRGPFGVTRTRVPGVIVCEHLPKQAAMMDRFTIIRSVDARHSNHEPNTVFQTGSTEAAPRVNPRGALYPAIGSVVSKFHGPNHPAVPAYAAFMRSRSHLAYAGYLGKAHDPFLADTGARLPIYDLVGKDTGRVSTPVAFRLPVDLPEKRLGDRRSLVTQLDRMKGRLDSSAEVRSLDRYGQQALDLLVGGRMQAALDLEREPARVRERYGKHLWCQQALLARRMIEAGVAFVTLDLSYHTASGTWDTHGDNIPPYGGIRKGLGPLLPLFDHLLTTLVDDLAQRGLLDDVLVIAMGEFGRTPQVGTQGSTDGRNHWPHVLSLSLAGGGAEARGGDRLDRSRRRSDRDAPGDAGRPGGDDLPAPGGAAGERVRRHDRQAVPGHVRRQGGGGTVLSVRGKGRERPIFPPLPGSVPPLTPSGCRSACAPPPGAARGGWPGRRPSGAGRPRRPARSGGASSPGPPGPVATARSIGSRRRGCC